jgi:hypothetical protein
MLENCQNNTSVYFCSSIQRTKFLEIEIKSTITFMKHVNKTVMNAAPKIRLRMTKITNLWRNNEREKNVR